MVSYGHQAGQLGGIEVRGVRVSSVLCHYDYLCRAVSPSGENVEKRLGSSKSAEEIALVRSRDRVLCVMKSHAPQ